MIFRDYSVELVERPKDILGAYEMSEIGARTCYKSENVIRYGEDGRSQTAKDFVENLINVRKHSSIAEHGTVYLKIPSKGKHHTGAIMEYYSNKYAIETTTDDYTYITTNLRVLYENNWLEDMNEYWSDEADNQLYHVPRLMFHFHSQCIISREAHRHRVHSPSEQSTRYCNYSKGKFGGNVSVNIPVFAQDCEQVRIYNKHPELNMHQRYCASIASNYEKPALFEDKFDYWMYGNLASEYAYLGMLSKGATTDEARTVLPLDTHTEFVHTAYIWDWFNFLKLRCSKYAHPDIRVLADIIKDTLISKGYFTQEEFDTYDDGWKLYDDKINNI